MIDRDQWLSALADAGVSRESDDRAVTLAEYRDAFGLKDTTARRHLRVLVTTGKATRTSKRTKDIAGRTITVTAYRLLEQGVKADVRVESSSRSSRRLRRGTRR